MSAAPPPARPGARLELLAAVCFFVAMVAFAALVVHRRLQARSPGPGHPLAGTVITPAPAREGVTVIPGTGRLLLVDSTPDGAALTLDGQPLGETPFSSDFRCDEAKPAVLEVKKPGYAPARFALDCVSGSTRVSVTLRRR